MQINSRLVTSINVFSIHSQDMQLIQNLVYKIIYFKTQ